MRLRQESHDAKGAFLQGDDWPVTSFAAAQQQVLNVIAKRQQGSTHSYDAATETWTITDPGGDVETFRIIR